MAKKEKNLKNIVSLNDYKAEKQRLALVKHFLETAKKISQSPELFYK